MWTPFLLPGRAKAAPTFASLFDKANDTLSSTIILDVIYAMPVVKLALTCQSGSRGRVGDIQWFTGDQGVFEQIGLNQSGHARISPRLLPVAK